MNPSQLEDLVRRIPELAPSPDLEDRIAKACRRRTKVSFWMIAPVAAAFLFCFGVVWMVSTPAGKGKKAPDSFRVRIVHEGAATCEPDNTCWRGGHWKLAVGDSVLKASTEIDGLLPKDRPIVLEGSPVAPWGPVRAVQGACVKAGIPEVDWRIGSQELKVQARPPRKIPLVDLKIRLEEIMVVLRADPSRDRGVRRMIGNRGTVDSDEDLLRIIRQMVVDYRKAGKTETTIFVDAAADVPWKEIVRVIELCRKDGLNDIELEGPQPELLPEVERPPDKKLWPGRPEDK